MARQDPAAPAGHPAPWRQAPVPTPAAACQVPARSAVRAQQGPAAAKPSYTLQRIEGSRPSRPDRGPATELERAMRFQSGVPSGPGYFSFVTKDGIGRRGANRASGDGPGGVGGHAPGSAGSRAPPEPGPRSRSASPGAPPRRAATTGARAPGGGRVGRPDSPGRGEVITTRTASVFSVQITDVRSPSPTRRDAPRSGRRLVAYARSRPPPRRSARGGRGPRGLAGRVGGGSPARTL